MKRFAINISIAFLSYTNISCLYENQNDCTIKDYEYENVIISLIESENPIFKGFTKKTVGFIGPSVIFIEKQQIDIPPPPSGGIILSDDIFSSNVFNPSDTSFVIGQLKNQNVHFKVFSKVFKKKLDNEVGVKKGFIFFELPIFSKNRKGVFIIVALSDYENSYDGHGYGIILEKRNKKFEIVSIEKKW